MEDMVAGVVSLAIGRSRSSSNRTRGQPQESDATCNSGSTGDKSAPRKVNGTRGSFNVRGKGSIIVVEDGTINSGYCAGNGNVNKPVLQNEPFVECNGTDEAFNVDEGGEISVICGSLNSGAFSGNSVNVIRRSADGVVPPSDGSTKPRRKDEDISQIKSGTSSAGLSSEGCNSL